MDTTTISLLFGSLGVGLFWWGSRHFARRCSSKTNAGTAVPDASDTANAPSEEAPSAEQTARVYRKILYLRLTGFLLCLFAAGSLLLQSGTGIAVVLAGAGLYMQYLAYRARTEHVFAVKKHVEKAFIATLNMQNTENSSTKSF